MKDLSKNLSIYHRDQRIVSLYKQQKGRYGLQAEIAREMKLSRQRVGQILKVNGVVRHNGKNRA